MERIFEFVGNHPILSLAFFGLLAALIWTEMARRFRGYKELSPQELTMLINREDAQVIDVSAIADFEKGHILSARHIAVSQFDPASKELSKLREQPVVLVCRDGAASGSAAAKLVKAGFTRVHWLAGGITAWTAANLPLTRGKSKNKSGKQQAS